MQRRSVNQERRVYQLARPGIVERTEYGMVWFGPLVFLSILGLLLWAMLGHGF